MSTFQKWAQFFPSKILGLQAFAAEFVDLLRAEHLGTIVDLHGGGGTFGSAGAAFTYAGALITIDAAYSGVTGDGHRLTYAPDGGGQPWSLGFEDVPFQDTGGTVYHVGALYVSVPARAERGIDGSISWGAFYDGIGKEYTPDSVTDLGGGTGLRFELTSALNSASKWASNADARPCVVYLVNPVTVTTEAVAVGSIVRTTGPHYRVSIAHYFGQGADDPSLTAADYRVIVLGPSFSTSSWEGTAPAIELGIMLSGVWNSAAAPLLYVVGNWIVAYGVEHHPDGTHGDVHADSILTAALQVDTGGGARDGVVYDDALECEDYDCSPYHGGWQWLTDPAISVPGYSVGPPTFVDNGTVGTTLDGVFPIPRLALKKDAGVIVWRLKTVTMRATAVLGQGAGSIVLKKRERGNDAAVIVNVGSVAFGFGGWASHVLTADIDLDPLYDYWLHVDLTNTGAVTDVEVGDAWITFEKRAVE